LQSVRESTEVVQDGGFLVNVALTVAGEKKACRGTNGLIRYVDVVSGCMCE